MNKPDTAQLREWASKSVTTIYAASYRYDEAVLKIVELCDYIDGQPEHCDHADRVRAEIRKFVAAKQAEHDSLSYIEILDFIDNGPKPKTAEEIAREAFRVDEDWSPNGPAELSLMRAVAALRRAGHIK